MSGALVAALSLFPSTARAHGGEGGEEEEFPVSFVERPMTLPRFVLAPFGELDVTHVPGTAVGGIQIGASFGITKNIEVGATVLPIQLNSPAGYGGAFIGEEGAPGQPSVYGLFRFLHTPTFDLGVRLGLTFVVPQAGLGSGATIEPSVPFLLHIGKIGRFDAEVGIPIAIIGGTTVTTVVNGVVVSASTGGTVAAGLDVPLRLAFDIIEPLHVGVSTGVIVDDLGHAGDTFRVPLGIFCGYAVGEKKPIVDIDPFFSFFNFLTPGVSGPGTSVANPAFWTLGVNARGFIYL